MGRKSPSLKNFFLSFGNHWAELMSGGFSVPFAVLTWQLDGIAKVIFGVTAILAFTFAAFRVWASERRALNKAEHRIKQLESEYPYSLHLGGIDFNLLNIKADAASATLKERRMGFTLHLRNTLHKPLEYKFQRIAIDGAETNLGNSRAVLSPNSEGIFRTDTVPTALDILHSPEQFTIELDYTYGEPENLTRRAIWKILLNIFHLTQKTDYSILTSQETAIHR